MSAYSYYWYITDDDGTRHICVISSDESNYTGTAKLFYTKLSDLDTTEQTNEPTIPKRYHMAMVWGVLSMMGFQKYYPNYRQLVNEAKSSNAGVGNGSITQYDF